MITKKFAKILKKYCQYNGMNFEKAKKIFDVATVKEQEEYKTEITKFVRARMAIMQSLNNQQSVMIHGTNKEELEKEEHSGTNSPEPSKNEPL